MYVSMDMQELQPVCITSSHTLTPRLETKTSLQKWSDPRGFIRALLAHYHQGKTPGRHPTETVLGEKSCTEPTCGALILRNPLSADFSSSSASPTAEAQEVAVICGMIVAARFRGERTVVQQRVMHRFWPRVMHTPMDKTFRSAYLAWGHLRWSAK